MLGISTRVPLPTAIQGVSRGVHATRWQHPDLRPALPPPVKQFETQGNHRFRRDTGDWDRGGWRCWWSTATPTRRRRIASSVPRSFARRASLAALRRS